MIRIGDKDVQYQGINDASDDRDAPIGTFKTLENFRLNEQENALVVRGGYPVDVALPETLYKDGSGGLVSTVGTAVDLEWVKCHACFYHKISEPEEKLIRVAICEYSYDVSQFLTIYMLRWLMYPYFDGSTFVNAWKDVTPYYIDWYAADNAIEHQISGAEGIEASVADTFIPHNWIFPYDVVDGYIYLEDTSLFTTPNNHLSEGDKIIDSPLNEFSSGYYLIVKTESDHSGWTGQSDVVRVHKNLETGKIKYDHLICQTEHMFDSWQFTSYKEGGRLVISVNPGKDTYNHLNIQYPAYRIQMSYIDTTYMGTGKLYSRADYNYLVSGTQQRFYDKHLVYGFPNYDNVFKTETVLNGKTLQCYSGNPAGAAGYSSTIINGSYNKIMGSFATSSGTPMGASSDYDGYLYKVSDDLDFTIPVKGFIFQEYDVHGHLGSFVDFDSAGSFNYTQSANLSCTPAFGRYYNFDEITNLTGGYGVAADTGEIGFDLTNDLNMLIQLHGVYNGYRIGLHNSDNSYDSSSSATQGVALFNASYPVLAHPVLIPCSFNRNIESYIMTLSVAEIKDDNKYTAQVENGKVVIKRSLKNNDFDFHLCFVDNSDGNHDLYGKINFNGRNVNYCYTRVERVDRYIYDSVSYGGNSLLITTNPDFSPLIPGATPEPETVLYGHRENYMRKDYSFGGNLHAMVRGRHFMADAVYHEYQVGAIQSETFKEKRVVWYTEIGEFGSSFHTFDANARRIWTTDLGDVTGLGVVNFPQGVGQALMEDRNNLLILCEDGYKFVDLLTNNPDEVPFRETPYHGDGCIAPKSVVSINGYVFCAGREEIYMFNGYHRMPISKMGACDIGNTWRAYSDEIKKSSVGVYDKSKKWYMLFVPETATETVIYIFDLSKVETTQEVKIYSDRITSSQMIDLLQPAYVDSQLYIPTEQALLKYDSTSYFDGVAGSDIYGTLLTNNISIDSFARRLSNIKIEFLNQWLDVIVYTDNNQVQSRRLYGKVVGLNVVDTSDIIKMNRTTKAGTGRGRRFALYINAQLFEDQSKPIIYDIDFSFTDVPQRRLIHRDV